MKVPCSLAISALGAHTESPLHALTANQTGAIEFWRVSAIGLSTTPALCMFSCAQLSGDGITDALNYYKWVTSHTWSFTSGGFTYTQEDTLDPNTLEALDANVITDTFPGGFNGGNPTIWNDPFGYLWTVPPTITSTAGGEWDKTPTRNAITAALDTVNWSDLWAGGTSANWFEYDRVHISPNQSGPLPFGGTASGNLVPSNRDLGPSKVLTGTVGQIGNTPSGGQSASDGLGVSLERTQIQVRNFHGPPIPYVIIETADVAGGVTVLGNPGSTVRDNAAISLSDVAAFYRKISEGVWDHDLQIIQLPDAAMNGPATITAGIGTRVRNGTIVFMIVGMTFEEYMEDLWGPTWGDHVFS